MKEIWFRRKKYGFGWIPCTWQGWFVTLLYVIIVFGNIARIDLLSHSVSDTLIGSVPFTLISTLLFIGICALMGEPPVAPKKSQKSHVVTKKKKKKKLARR